MRQYSRLIKSGLSSIAIATSMTAPGYAQSSTGGPVALEEVVVTAERREENLQTVPISVSAFSGEDLANRRVSNLHDILRLVPSVSFTTAGGNDARTDISMRGIANQGGAASPFAFYVDETSIMFSNVGSEEIGSVRGFDANLFEIERFEILRGPQGTYFGKNAVGGAFNVTTKKPTDKLEGSISSDLGFEGTTDYGNPVYTIKGMLNVPVSEKVLFRANGYFERADGWLRDIGPAKNTNDRKAYGIRAATRIIPNDRVTLDASFSRSLRKAGINSDIPTGVGLQGIACSLNIPTTDPVTDSIRRLGPSDPLPNYSVFCPLGALGVGGAPVNSGQGFYPGNKTTIATDHKSASLNRTNMAEARLQYDFESFTWTNIAGWVDNHAYDGGDLDASTVDYIDGINGRTDVNGARGKNLSFETRLASKSHAFDRLTWSIGGIVSDDKGTRSIDANWGNSPQVIPPFRGLLFAHFLSALDTTSYAAFGQATYAIMDNVDVTAGLRYSHDRITSTQVTASATLPVSSPEFSKVASFNDVSPKVSISYKWSDDILTYGSVSKGYKAGGFNPSFAATPDTATSYRPENLWNYEIGVKSELLDHRLRFNASMFYMDWKDLQVSFFNAQTFSFDTGNAGSARSKGLEFEVNAAPSRSTLVGVSYGYNDAKYKRFQNCQVIETNRPLEPIVRDCSGLPFGTKHQVATFAQYDFPVMSWGGYIRAEYSWRSALHKYSDLQEVSDPRATPFLIGSYDTVNFRGGVKGESWSVDIYAENAIGGIPAVGSRRLFTFLSGTQVTLLPRQFGIRTAFNF